MKLNPQTTAFVFPGQGSQVVGMGRELAETYPVAKETFEEADSVLGFSLSQLMWQGPAEELNETINTQPALYVHSVAAWRTFALHDRDFRPAAVADRFTRGIAEGGKTRTRILGQMAGGRRRGEGGAGGRDLTHPSFHR